MNSPGGEPSPLSKRALEVFAAFARLGLTAFGGPVAHLGYFRDEFVVRRRWISEADYADLVALCQFLPGPASSQVGFAIGLQRAGAAGALAAWAGFTLPSAVLMTAFAFGAAGMTGPLAQGLIHGLKLVAVAVVAQAVFGMARTLTPDVRRMAIALGAAAIVTLASAQIGQVAAIAAGALAGLAVCRGRGDLMSVSEPRVVRRRTGFAALVVFLVLLVGGPWVAAMTDAQALKTFDAFYRSGALVFGGGHVVLPLLNEAVVAPGWIDKDAFLAGYGAAQAMPGPLFTFAAYLGAAMNLPPNGVAGAVLALAAVFLPGMLILVAALPFWGWLRTRPAARSAIQGSNAAVVGILGAALYHPVWTSSVLSPADAAAALAGFVLLTGLRVPPVAIVVLGAAFGVAQAAL